MWHGKYISYFTVFLILFSLVKIAYSADIGQIKINGDDYVSVTENPNADSSGIGWIPEGDFVMIVDGPFVGTLGRIPVKWHQIEYKKKKGFVFSHLLNFYAPSLEGKKNDIARIKVNGNGYVNLRANSNIDSSPIGCIPEGKIVKVLSEPIQGYIGDINGHWYKIKHQGSTGFIWGGLLEFYFLPSQNQEGFPVVDESDKKKLADMVIDMIKNGKEIVFTYQNGELSLDTLRRDDRYYNRDDRDSRDEGDNRDDRDSQDEGDTGRRN